MAYTTDSGVCAYPGWGSCDDNCQGKDDCGSGCLLHAFGFRYEYPYVDAGVFNQDWLLNKMKELLCRMCKLRRDWEAYKQQLQAAWEAFQNKMESDWTDYQNQMNEAWQNYQDKLNKEWADWKAQQSTDWTNYQEQMQQIWQNYQNTLNNEWSAWKQQQTNEWNLYKTQINQKLQNMETDIYNFKQDVPTLIQNQIDNSTLENPVWATAAGLSPSPYMLAMRGKKLFVITDDQDAISNVRNLSSIGGSIQTIYYATISALYSDITNVMTQIDAFAPNYLVISVCRGDWNANTPISLGSYAGTENTFDYLLRSVLRSLVNRNGIVVAYPVFVCVPPGTSALATTTTSEILKKANPLAAYQAICAHAASVQYNVWTIDLRSSNNIGSGISYNKWWDLLLIGITMRNTSVPDQWSHVGKYVVPAIGNGNINTDFYLNSANGAFWIYCEILVGATQPDQTFIVSPQALSDQLTALINNLGIGIFVTANPIVNGQIINLTYPVAPMVNQGTGAMEVRISNAGMPDVPADTIYHWVMEKYAMLNVCHL